MEITSLQKIFTANFGFSPYYSSKYSTEASNFSIIHHSEKFFSNLSFVRRSLDKSKVTSNSQLCHKNQLLKTKRSFFVSSVVIYAHSLHVYVVEDRYETTSIPQQDYEMRLLAKKSTSMWAFRSQGDFDFCSELNYADISLQRAISPS